MPVHAVVPGLLHDVRNVDGLIADLFADLAFRDRVPAELAGQDHQRAIEQPAFVEVAYQLRDRRVDELLHVGRSLMPVLVSIPVHEWDVLGGDLHVPRTAFDEPPRKKTALAKAARVVGIERCLRLEPEVKRLGRRGLEQSVRGVQRLHHGFALKRAAVAVHGLLPEQLFEQLPPALETGGAELFGRPHG